MSVSRIPSSSLSRSGLRSELDSWSAFGEVIGNSPQMQAVFRTLEKVADADVPVLITGQGGTGKELAARTIHDHSRRRAEPFLAIDCALTPDTLLEAELFDDQDSRDQDNGARIQRDGRGTLFLDEVTELSPALQLRLLRFLRGEVAEASFGREPSFPVDVRVIAATKTDLKQAIAGGRFREDLYYRLSIVEISLPLLSERPGDVEVLAEAFLAAHCGARGQNLAFTAEAIEAMKRYPWPGNVGELENRVQRGVIMAENGEITPQDLEIADGVESSGNGLGEARQVLERQMVQAALARHGGNISRAASDLKISRPTLYELIARLGIERR